MKTDIENSDLPSEWYVIEIDGKIETKYGVYFGMELKQKFPLSLVKVRETDKTSVSS